MKILITAQMVDRSSPLLGFFHGWLEEFAARFEEVHVICLYEGEHDLPSHVHIYSLGKESGASRAKYIFRFYKYFTYIFFHVRVNYVFFHMGAVYNVMASPFFLVRKLFNTSFYWWKTHGQLAWRDRVGRFFVDRVYTAIDESYPLNTPKKTVVGHAIDTELFRPSTEVKKPRSILFVGRIAPSKRLEDVIEVTKHLRDAGVNVSVTCIGPVVDSEYMVLLSDKVAQDNLAEQIVFVPGVPHDELVKYYQQAMVFINPAQNDGLDKVVLEAMLCGTVPLTSNGSFRRVLEPYDLFLERGDITGYVQRVQHVLSLPEKDYNTLAESLGIVVQTAHARHTLMDRIFGNT